MDFEEQNANDIISSVSILENDRLQVREPHAKGA